MKCEYTRVDELIGSMIRKARILKGVSQEDIGNYLGVSFQQIQKYEKGQSKITASKLSEVANYVNQDISYFYHFNDDIQEESSGFSLKEEQSEYISPDSNNKEVIALIKAYMSIKEEPVRKKLLALIKSL